MSANSSVFNPSNQSHVKQYTRGIPDQYDSDDEETVFWGTRTKGLKSKGLYKQQCRAKGIPPKELILKEEPPKKENPNE